MRKHLLNLILPFSFFAVIAQSPPVISDVVVDWDALQDNGRRTAEVRWYQSVPSQTTCVHKTQRMQYILLDCFPGVVGWHAMPLPMGAPSDGMHWADEGDLYFLETWSPYSVSGPYGLEHRYWLVLIGR